MAFHLMGSGTVNLEIFSRIGLKDIFISVNDKVVLPFREVFFFTNLCIWEVWRK